MVGFYFPFSSSRKDVLLCLFDRFQKELVYLVQIYGEASPATAGVDAMQQELYEHDRVHEKFMEVCLILFAIGDVLGCITVDVEGFVNPSLSDPSFLEGFVMCVEITHVFCLKLLASHKDFVAPVNGEAVTRVYTVVSVFSDCEWVFSTPGRAVEIGFPWMEKFSEGGMSMVQLLKAFLDVSNSMFAGVKGLSGCQLVSSAGPSNLGSNVFGVRFLRMRNTEWKDALVGDVMQRNVSMVLLLKNNSLSAGMQQRRLAELEPRKELHCEFAVYPRYKREVVKCEETLC